MIEQNHYNLRHHNTFGITAYCHRFVEYSDVEQLRALLPQLKASGCEWLHIGGGSNLLFTRDYPGTILHSAITGIEVCPSDDDQVLVTAGAGLVWDNFVEWTLRQGYYGLPYIKLRSFLKHHIIKHFQHIFCRNLSYVCRRPNGNFYKHRNAEKRKQFTEIHLKIRSRIYYRQQYFQKQYALNVILKHIVDYIAVKIA